ncbi:hypothetical protein D9V41_12670 [Aeromicrobium phragmitis]|uniref:DUF676 domain-containing protein n=1 Tax=Aeromicrobium phragmitis TaxID=2478914 RepID=A0A3L8PIG9_9ACTN|nr:hypothetical protein [Aeromicrobium phragmitis]RLV55166.1 hypothetical protein D9V41_12670 [Aeromicrobium phragmitis]
MPSTTARTTDVAALALECGDRWVLGPLRDAHLSLAHRVFAPARSVGGRTPERIHETIARSAYGGVSAALRLGSAGARGLSRRGIGRPIDDTAAGRRLRAAVNGLVGEHLRSLDDPHALAMSVRASGRDIAPARWALREAFPGATGHLVVFVHGLCQDDESWQFAQDDRPTYLDRVRDQTDGTPLAVRYNTGLPVAENGRLLTHLLRGLVQHWPARVRRVTLVGHSMGAVVVRAALSHAAAAHEDWTGLVRDVVCLGSPHLGAPWEKASEVSASIVSSLPSPRPVLRSLEPPPAAGSLRFGIVDDELWEGRDVTAVWGHDRLAVAPLPHVAYRFVAAGDGPLGERALLNHPVVGARLVAWLSRRDDRPRSLPAR